jgi:hypothetical protein
MSKCAEGKRGNAPPPQDTKGEAPIVPIRMVDDRACERNTFAVILCLSSIEGAAHDS